MMPMQCPKCSHDHHRVSSTNGQLTDQTMRQRMCEACGHKWFTVEVAVPSYAVGWTSSSGRPVLRAPLTVEVSAPNYMVSLNHEEPKDQMAGLRAWNEQKSRAADARHRVTDCD